LASLAIIDLSYFFLVTTVSNHRIIMQLRYSTVVSRLATRPLYDSSMFLFQLSLLLMTGLLSLNEVPVARAAMLFIRR